jgi:hypothetical protein
MLYKHARTHACTQLPTPSPRTHIHLSLEIYTSIGITCIKKANTYIYICLTRKGNTTIIEAPFLGSGCGRVV